MKRPRLATVQHGMTLVEALVRPAARKRSRGRKGARGAGRRAAVGRAAAGLKGPLLSPGALSAAERLRLLDGIQKILEAVFTHLPLKRARYGFDPVQRLCILRTQLRELSDDAFHIELADIVTRLRDAHTRYVGPRLLDSKVAALPFLVEQIGSADSPAYVVTKVGRGVDPSFKPGVVLEYWNGVPIDRAILRHADREVGGRPDSQRAWACQSLTLRSLQYGPPPDEHWVTIGYRSVGSGTRLGPSKEVTIDWRVVDPSEIESVLEGGPTGARAKALRRTRAINPAAEAIRRAKMLLFAPHALTGRQAAAPSKSRAGTSPAPAAEIVPTTLTETLKAMSIPAAGGTFGYLRIYGFDTEPEAFVSELMRLIPQLPDRGLILDIRGNPGGYIWAAEMALQLFTPNRIEPTRFSVLATPFTRQIAAIGDVAEDLAPWRASLDAAVRNGELYAQPIPITDPDACNALGQQYGGPVVLVADSTTYSSGDLFSAGFVDNAVGPFICVGSATGAGGANVWTYSELRQALAGSAAALPALPEGIDLSFSFRRATRARASEGLPIEDVGVSGAPYAMTRDDLLQGNRDLIAACIAVLKRQPFSRLSPVLDRPGRTITVATRGLDRVDTFVDGHPATSHAVNANASLTIPYPAGTAIVDVSGFAGGVIRQRRRLAVRG
jgi:C-terminal processing protease CtpA/Prc